MLVISWNLPPGDAVDAPQEDDVAQKSAGGNPGGIPNKGGDPGSQGGRGGGGKGGSGGGKGGKSKSGTK
jgi:hypothetical protein